MARYKVDKKKFDEKLLEEQLRSVELQKKYLKDEPLKRSEVDEYNKLQANGWIKNTLISLGVTFATAIAVVVFVLLGNMLFTNGRTGNVGAFNLNSSDIVAQVKRDLGDELFKQPTMLGDYKVDEVTGLPIYDENGLPIYEVLVVTTIDPKPIIYKVPFKTSDPGDPNHVSKQLLMNQNHEVYVVFFIEWRQNYDGTNKPAGGEWLFTDEAGSYGDFYKGRSLGRHNDLYELDIKNTNLNRLMTDWFLGQEDGWAKTMIQDFFYTAWPLTLVLWMIFFIVVAGYLVVMVVGVRYVIRTVIGTLRRAGYIASDFVSEVVDSVRSELPIVDEDQAEELDLVAVRKQVQKKLAQDDSLGGLPEYKFEPEDNLEEDVPTKKESLKEVKEEVKPVVTASPEPVVEEPKEENKKESKAKDKITDIFDL